MLWRQMGWMQLVQLFVHYSTVTEEWKKIRFSHFHKDAMIVLGRQPRDVWLDELGTNIRPWLKNWPRLDEWGTTQFYYHRIPNDSPTSKTQTTDFFSSAIALPDSPMDKGSKNWAGIDDGDTTQNWCQINKLTPYSAKLVTTDKLSAAIHVPDTLNIDPLDTAVHLG